MSDKRKGDDSNVVNRHKREKQSRKPAPLPIRSAPDIFASSEATHLLDKNEETSLLNTIQQTDSEPSSAFTEEAQSTQILTVDSATVTIETSQRTPSQNKEVTDQSTHQAHASTTQLLDVPSPDTRSLFDGDETTRALSGMFDENAEKTAFFHTQDERAIPKAPSVESRVENKLVDPTPRRTLNQKASNAPRVAQQESSDAPSPLPRSTKTRTQSSAKEPRPKKKDGGYESNKAPRANKGKASKSGAQKERRIKKPTSEPPQSAEPLNLGVFSEDASVVMDDVINQVVKDSWQKVPASKQTISKDIGPQTRQRFTTTQSLWLRIIVGFSILLAVGFLLRSKPTTEEKPTAKRPSSLVTPLTEQLPKLGLELPLSDSARKLRPGTDVFIIGRQRILLLVDGMDQSQLIHADSLTRTIKNSANPVAVQEQLSGVKAWPQELALGLDKSTSISQVQRLSTVLGALGVIRINLLTDSQSVGGIGELGIDVRRRTGSIPAVGALEMRVESALISIARVTPSQPPETIKSLDAFTPSLHRKLDEQVETFSFEHPRVVRAFLKVPEGLRLSQVIELARPLVHDERMRRITVIPYLAESDAK